ncbi:hemerythrin domain-containing protein [Yinghuangia sp. ASG 101]|uniref:hemerythrin domain-containing protein n=1 Tax=Yinghuangia sp. ASG 101 TaxID=2896848 RepID=UPI001E2BC40E|nr:hemerythrin domain-containing protein [Yinghuangia sp. ASG 101]UGQ13887.1 hemerythrin domain-containing protein [Yinghuangia sp. ASG 101]
MSAMNPAPIRPDAIGAAKNADASTLLRRGLSPAADADGVRMLRTGLRQLRAELREHVAAMEGPDGFYDEVRRDEPRLSGTVSRLRREHGRLNAMVDDLDRWMARGAADRAKLNAARPRVRELLEQWGSHRNRDHQLAYEAVSLDLGGED